MIYGRAVGDLQMKLLTLNTQGMMVFGQPEAATRPRPAGRRCRKSLTTTADKVAAAIGLLQRGDLDVEAEHRAAVRN